MKNITKRCIFPQFVLDPKEDEKNWDLMENCKKKGGKKPTKTKDQKN